MGQLVSDVTSILNYRDSKKEAANERQKILAGMANDERENMVHPGFPGAACPQARY